MSDWDTKKTIIFLAPFILIALVGLVWLLARRTIWTRFRMARQLNRDPDIKEFLVVFNWSRKILYLPTILASLAACVVTFLLRNSGDTYAIEIIGGVWLGVFFLNFLIDEFQITLKVLLMVILFLLLLFLWLAFLGWTEDFLRFFAHLGVQINWVGYLVLALIFGLAVAVSWLHGLFYYVAITPNYMNIRSGPTENSEQVSREEFRTRIDTGDFLERMLGFGQVVITFTDTRRPPIILLVGRIGRVATVLESIRANLSIDLYKAPATTDGGGGN